MNAFRRAAVIALGLALAAGCGTGSGLPPRPIETLMYVTGAAGTAFMFADAAACGSEGTAAGLQSPNANHQFGDRIFYTPYLFVLENLQQPMRAVIRNVRVCQDGPNVGQVCTDDSQCAPATCAAPLPIQVNVFLGTVQRIGSDKGTIQPGECRTIITDETAKLVPPNPPLGAQAQIEVCSPLNSMSVPDVSLPCVGSTADRHITYFATVGDVANSSITNCLLTPLLPACQTPSTFFLEQPKDEVDAVMSVNAGQNPGGLPRAEVRLQLYIDGRNVANDGGTNPVVQTTL